MYKEVLANLLTAVLIHGHYPETLLLATIVSIPKDNLGDLCDDNNYRGIALSSMIGKVLDKVLLQKNCKQLDTSHLQFAYKKEHGTSMCTLVVKEIIKYYIHRQTDVFSCFVDASKAFDKVRHDKLFAMLIRRGVSVPDIRLILNMYTRQKVRTVWQNGYSAPFSAVNGIRQGSISSPVLFCCYMDELISRLQRKGTGCWIGNYFCGSIAYADDLTLLSPTAAGLQCLLTVCEEYGAEYGMSYNPTKSHCVLFSKKKRNPPDLMLNGQLLRWEKQAKHLGNVIACDLSEKADGRLKKSDLVGRVNVIVGSLHELSSDIILKMFASQCCHYYGTQTWQLYEPVLRDFTTMWNRCVRRLLSLPNRTHCRFLPKLANMKDPTDQICSTFLRLFKTMQNSSNEIVKFMAERGMNDAQSIIGGNLHFMCRRYNLTRRQLVSMSQLVSKCTDVDLCSVQVIKDILQNGLRHIFSDTELFEFFNEICCN